MYRSAAVLVAGPSGIERLGGIRFRSLRAGCHGGFRGLMTQWVQSREWPAMGRRQC